MHAKLLLQGGEDSDGGARGGGARTAGENALGTELLPSPQVNVVDFNDVHINERATRKVGAEAGKAQTERRGYTCRSWALASDAFIHLVLKSALLCTNSTSAAGASLSEPGW